MRTPRPQHRLGSRVVALASLCCVLPACGDEAHSEYQPGDELLGGDTTVFDEGLNAFSLAARNLQDDRRESFFVGNSTFNRNWVSAPASTTGLDGLGPTFNARSCSACHFKDGRGAPPQQDGDEFVGLLLRLSVPGEDVHGGPLGEPSYGGQFNHRSILGVPAEGTASVSYEEVPGKFVDGTRYSLRRPRYEFSDLQYGPMDDAVQVSPRVAQAMVGLGLLEAIDEDTLLALADEDDADDDGISGRPNYVWDERAGRARLGRFGWKANQPTLEQQTSGAFLGDIGITSPMFSGQNCPEGQQACLDAADGGDPEIDQDKIDEVTYYAHLLAVPAQRDFQGERVLHGKQLFRMAGCDSCHVSELQTGELEDFAELSGQTIRPYTDLLLHDMGDDLADHRPDYLASGTEWRTAPLWGIGLVSVVNGHTNFLHDGRARDLSEAILWHGGEAEAAREAYRTLSKDDREDLIRFLESL